MNNIMDYISKTDKEQICDKCGDYFCDRQCAVYRKTMIAQQEQERKESQ